MSGQPWGSSLRLAASTPRRKTMKTTLTRSCVALLALTTALTLTACGGGEPAKSGDAGVQASAAQSQSGESEAFVADLTEGVRLINEQIDKESTPMTSVMLASDVDQPTQKYGMWVLPYHPSDAVKKFTMKIEITDGTDFAVSATSAETGKTWKMNQDGELSEDA
jgi:hypothetical protein